MGRTIPVGWPEVYTYSLMESSDSKLSGSAIVELDGDRIVSRRRPADAGWGSCNPEWLEPLNPTTRHRLIAYWLGVGDGEMAWQPVQYVTIVWAGKADYERRLGEIVESQREKLRATVKALQERGFLSESEAATVMPRLSVAVKCEIKPCPLLVN